MTEDELNELEQISQVATPGPWYVRQLDDELRCGAVAVSTKPETGKNEDMRSGSWPGKDVVAACLIQNPPYAVPADDKYDENARLIAKMRNHLPELIRLARESLQ